MEATAAEAVDGFLKALAAEGYDDLAKIQAIEGGRGFDRGLAVLMNTGAAKYYGDHAQQLWDAGIKDPRYYQVLRDNANEVNSLILQKLAALGFDVKRLEESVRGDRQG